MTSRVWLTLRGSAGGKKQKSTKPAVTVERQGGGGRELKGGGMQTERLA